MSKKDDKPNTGKVSSLRAWLVDKGMSSAEAAAMVKASRSYGEIAGELVTWLRGRKKKSK